MDDNKYLLNEISLFEKEGLWNGKGTRNKNYAIYVAVRCKNIRKP